MPSTSINGRSIYYEVHGSGPPVVLSPGGRNGVEHVLPLAEKLAAACTVLVWDRANLGRSDVCFDGACDLDLWTDQLDGLLRVLGLRPAYLAAASSGARVSLRMALRYPDAVKGLFLWLLSGGDVAEILARNYYGEAAEIAERDGMSGVAQMPYWAGMIRTNPANRGWLEARDPSTFAGTMRRWAASIRSEDLLIGVPESDLARIRTRTRIVAGSDDYGHTRARMEGAARAMPCAELIDPAGFREEWLQIRQRSAVGMGYEQISQLPALITDFIREDAPRP